MAPKSRYSLFLRSDHHDHLPSFHLRHLFNRTVFFQVISDPSQQLRTEFLVRHLPAPESQGDLRLVTVLEKLHEFPELDLVIAFVRPRAKLDFLDVNPRLLAFRRLVFLVLLEQVLAKIHDAAYRRIRHRGYFNEVQSLVIGQFLRVGDVHDPCLLTIGTDNPHRGRIYFIVAPYALIDCDTQILHRFINLPHRHAHAHATATAGTRFYSHDEQETTSGTRNSYENQAFCR